MSRFFRLFIFSVFITLGAVFSEESAGAQNYTMRVPDEVPNGSKFLLFGQGWGEGYAVRNGQVTIPGDVNATSIFGNFKLPNGGWYEVPEQISSLSSGSGWAAVIHAGECQGNQYECDATEHYSDDETHALVVDIEDNQRRSSFDVFVEGGYIYLGLPDRLNSVSFSGVENRRSLGLSTGGKKGLINVDQLLQEHVIIGVKPNNGRAQGVETEEVSSQQYSSLVRFPVSSGQCVQFAYQDRTGEINAWSTVGAARNLSGLIVKGGNGAHPVGPYCYEIK